MTIIWTRSAGLTPERLWCVIKSSLRQLGKHVNVLQANSSSGKWCVAQLPFNGAKVAADAPLLEFVVHNGQGEWDKPDTGI